jgi:hypothetical protein
MELDHVILADVISPRPDGKLDLHGVGWDTIFAPAVPATHPRMDVAIRFLLSPHELEAAHQVVVTLISADGVELTRMDAGIQPMPAEARAAIPPGRRFGIGMILNMASVTFPEYGDYSLVITWDGNEPRTPLSLYVAPLQFPGPFAFAELIRRIRNAQAFGARAPAHERARHRSCRRDGSHRSSGRNLCGPQGKPLLHQGSRRTSG